MIELFIFALLALHGLACTTILALLLWKSARERDHHHEDLPVPSELEPPDVPYPVLERHPADEVFAVLGDCFPDSYVAWFEGRLTPAEQQDLWTMCCAVHDARAEIEELCS